MSTLTSLFTSIANAIRSKKGSNETISPNNFAEEISSIPTSSSDYSVPVEVTADNGALITATLQGDTSVTASTTIVDTKNSVFLPQAGTWNIIASKDGVTKGPLTVIVNKTPPLFFNLKSRLPAEYKEIEYIETNGQNNCLVNVGANFYVGNNYNVRYQADILLLEPATTGCLIGNEYYSSSSTNGYYRYGNFIVCKGQKLGFNCIQVNGNSGSNMAFPTIYSNITLPTSKFTLIWDYNAAENSKYIQVNDQQYQNFDSKNCVVTGGTYAGLFHHMIISVYNYSKSYTNIIKGRLYGSQCYSYTKGELISQRIPCIRISDGKPGLYDIIQNFFYYAYSASNSITPVDYIAGPEV